MTRLFTEGAEMQDLLFWSTVSPVDMTVVSTSPTPFLSPYTYKLSSSGGGGTATKILPAAISEIYMRERVIFQTQNASYRFPVFRTGTTEIAWLGMSATFQLIAQATTIGVLQTSSLTMMSGQWYEIEIHFKEDDSPNGIFVAYVDGNLVINYSGDTKPSTATTFDNIWYPTPGGATYIGIDDLAANDTTGDFDNSWCGDGVVIKLNPSGSGTMNSWLNSGSVSGSSNYLYVDDFPNDGETTYVYSSASSIGDKDHYVMETFDDTNKSINRIWAESTAKKTSSGSGTIKIGYLPLGGTDQLSSGLTLSIGNYSRIVGTSGSTNPVTGLEWTKEDIDGLQYVSEIS